MEIDKKRIRNREGIEWESSVKLDGSNRSFGGGSRQKFDSFIGRFRRDSGLDSHSIPSRFWTRFLSISTDFPTFMNNKFLYFIRQPGVEAEVFGWEASGPVRKAQENVGRVVPGGHHRVGAHQ